MPTTISVVNGLYTKLHSNSVRHAERDRYYYITQNTVLAKKCKSLTVTQLVANALLRAKLCGEPLWIHFVMGSITHDPCI